MGLATAPDVRRRPVLFPGQRGRAAASVRARLRGLSPSGGDSLPPQGSSPFRALESSAGGIHRQIGSPPYAARALPVRPWWPGAGTWLVSFLLCSVTDRAGCCGGLVGVLSHCRTWHTLATHRRDTTVTVSRHTAITPRQSRDAPARHCCDTGTTHCDNPATPPRHPCDTAARRCENKRRSRRKPWGSRIGRVPAESRSPALPPASRLFYCRLYRLVRSE